MSPSSPSSPPQPSSSPLRVAVIGAGAFGGWTALSLLRRGARVTLFDAWGPGHGRASSGGESRVIRGMYGADRVYVDWTVRSFELWEEANRRWGERLIRPTRVLWMFSVEDGYARTSLPLLEAAGLPTRELAVEEARKRYPQVDLSGVRTVFLEERAGVLAARKACLVVARGFAAEGGEVRRGWVSLAPSGGGGDVLARLRVDGEPLTVAGAPPDRVVFACGPWMGELFPELLAGRLRPTRQDVFYFGRPPGLAETFSEPVTPDGEGMPVWIDFGERIFYGIPGEGPGGEAGPFVDDRGFKVADDTRGETLDPSRVDRTPDPEALERARDLLARRFPALTGAPLLESRVCQYANTLDGHLVADRHPEDGRLWLLGGGSGHGFKLSPALGEAAAGWVLEEGEPPQELGLDRLHRLRAELEAGSGAERTQFSG